MGPDSSAGSTGSPICCLLIAQAACGPGGVVAMAGKISGRFAVKLHEMRAAFEGWREIASGQNEVRCFLIVEKPVVTSSTM